MILNGGDSDADVGGGLTIGLALFKHFDQLAAIEFAFDAAQTINEQPTVKVIELVLKCDGLEIGGFGFDFFLLGRPRPNENLRSTLDLGAEIDHGETSLLPHD